MPTDYGNFHNFCRDSTLPICNLFSEALDKGGKGYGGCQLKGISLSNGNHLRNLGSILLCGLAIVVSAGLLFLSQRKRAAVGRREIQLFLLGYIIVSICEIFTVGGFPLNDTVRIAFTGIHIGAITATAWILMLNGVVGYQLMDDGTALSMLLILGSAAAVFVGTGYIALDTGFNWTGYWNTALIQQNPNREYSMYTLYLLAPLVFLFVFFALESVLVLTVLGEVKPMLWLGLSALSFGIGQVFQFVVSVHICTGTQGKIDGAMFETFFTLIAVVLIYVFWSSITEDDWTPTGPEEPTY